MFLQTEIQPITHVAKNNEQSIAHFAKNNEISFSNCFSFYINSLSIYFLQTEVQANIDNFEIKSKIHFL